MRVLARVISILFLAVFVSCKEKLPFSEEYFAAEDWDSCYYTEFQTEEFQINTLSYEDLPHVDPLIAPDAKRTQDINGLPIYSYNGYLNYHPASLAKEGLYNLHLYHTDKKHYHRKMVKKACNKLLGMGIEHDSTIFFPYSFDFRLHGMIEETVFAPWFSGKGQGFALSLFSRMYEETGDTMYLYNSRRIFNSFKKLKADNYTWVSCVDPDGYLWIEEYPLEAPSFSVNGQFIAAFGIYDYYRVSTDQEALHYLQGVLTTIKNNIYRFRREGEVSSYCLKHDAQAENYHRELVLQLEDLWLITSDSAFLKASEDFKSDFF